MSGFIYLEANSLYYAAAAGGVDLLNTIADYWQAKGYTLVASDVLQIEVNSNTSASAQVVRDWMTARAIPAKPTSFGGANYVKGQSYGEHERAIDFSEHLCCFGRGRLCRCDTRGAAVDIRRQLGGGGAIHMSKTREAPVMPIAQSD